jgi:RNA polymerase sigma-70 factor, ECF subfamily
VVAEFQNVSDEELARQTQAGSLTAFEELVYRYEGRIYAFVSRCCRNGTDAREVTQETFVRAFQAIGQFDPRRGFASWLFTIARRKAIDHHRAARHTVGEEAIDEQLDDEDPSELLARQEEQRNLWRLARAKLSEAQFQVLWLRYAEEMTVAEIARVVSKTQIHVKVILFRAREVLGRALKAARSPAGPNGLAVCAVSGGLEAALARPHEPPARRGIGCGVCVPRVVSGQGPIAKTRGLL